jgi:ABC-type glutathione transport system ATPase component
MIATSACVAVDAVSKTFGPSRHRSVVAVDHVSLSFASGGPTVGIVGESGSGKSTLARILAGLEHPSSGTVTFNDADLSGVLRGRASRLAFRTAVQFVGQDTSSSFDPRRTLREAVRLPLMLLNGLEKDAADRRVDEMLTVMGLSPGYADRRPHQVSGGQRQRFAIARGLVVGPRLLICDEVVSALDVSVQGSILNMLKRYCADSGAGLVFVSHGLAATAFISDELVVMYRGQVVDQGKTEDILHGKDVHPYTAMLLEAHRGPRVGAA